MKAILRKDKYLAAIGERPAEVTDNIFDDVAAAILEEENRCNNREDKQTSSRQVKALVATRGRLMEPGSSESGKSKTRKKKNFKCFKCDKPGHFRKDCWGLNTSHPQGNVASTSEDGNVLCCEAPVVNESRKRFTNGLEKNLLSLGQLEDLSCNVEIQNKIMKIIKGALVLMKGEKVAANLYQLKGEIIEEAEASVASDSPSHRVAVTSKQHRLKFKTSNSRSVSVLELVYSDVWQAPARRNQKAVHNDIHSSIEWSGRADEQNLVRKSKSNVGNCKLGKIILGESPNKDCINKLKAQLAREFEMKDIGPTNKILGMQTHRDRVSRKIWLSQKSYVKKILQRFNMQDCKPISTMFPTNVKLSSKMSPSSEKERMKISQVLYALAVGSLMFAMICTRPDIAHAVGVVSRLHGGETPFGGGIGEHWEAMKRILRYIKGTSNVALCFGESDLIVKGYVDSDYAVVEMSTTEAEYVVAAQASKEAVWLKMLNPSFHSKTKHMRVQYHFIREKAEEGTVDMQKIHTDDNVADYLTKAIKGDKFIWCRSSCCLAEMGLYYCACLVLLVLIRCDKCFEMEKGFLSPKGIGKWNGVLEKLKNVANVSAKENDCGNYNTGSTQPDIYSDLIEVEANIGVSIDDDHEWKMSWGRSSYERAIIKLRAHMELKDTLAVAIPKFEGEGYTMSTIRVDYEWKPPRFSNFTLVYRMISTKKDSKGLLGNLKVEGTSTLNYIKASSNLVDEEQKEGVGENDACICEDEEFDVYDGYEDQVLDLSDEHIYFVMLMIFVSEAKIGRSASYRFNLQFLVGSLDWHVSLMIGFLVRRLRSDVVLEILTPSLVRYDGVTRNRKAVPGTVQNSSRDFGVELL
ncbi:retrovirus-related pol polyprotein from transposon TNT 1-94 [Tanacetum coccineum]